MTINFSDSIIVKFYKRLRIIGPTRGNLEKAIQMLTLFAVGKPSFAHGDSYTCNHYN
jgi:hypothetical protein